MLRVRGLDDARRRGLTLTELLVVVGIIAILIAILVPVVGRARAQGRNVQCLANLRQFDVAFKGQDVNKPDTRLPQAEKWMTVVAASAPGAHKTLQCPDGALASGMSVDGGGAYFHVWQGNGSGSPNGSRLNGDALWRESRTAPLADGSFTLSYRTKPNGPQLVIGYKPLGGERWRASVAQHPGAPYRGDAVITSDGRRFESVKSGFTVDYDATAGAADYGFNYLASRLDGAKAGKVVVMDFNKPVFDFDGWQTATQPDDYLPATVLSQRHLKKINALLSDGSVQSFLPAEIAPANPIYAIAASRGPNPGAPEPPASTGSGNSGGGNSGGNGGGNNGGGNSGGGNSGGNSGGNGGGNSGGGNGKGPK